MPEKIKTTDGVTITETEPVNEKSRWTRSLNYNERSEYESGKKYFDCCDWFSMPELEPFDFANGSIGMKFACKNIQKYLVYPYNPKDGLQWNDLANVMRIDLPLCAQCKEYSHQPDNVDNGR